jgi:3-methyladenine DNA glycosylase AlkD
MNTSTTPEGPPDQEQVLPRLRRDLELEADPEFRVRAAEYCQREVGRFLGVRTPVVRQIGARYFEEIKPLTIDAILQLCEELLETGLSEHRTIAFDWAFRCRRKYRPDHFDVLERWLGVYVESWGSCDDLCTHALGDFVLRYPEFIPRVKEWSRSENRWQRRASAVTLIYGARRGKNLAHVLEVADALLTDPDDMVQKGYGWMLKVASKTFPNEVFEYVMRHKSEMPRTALRYAIEKLPEAERRRAMEK